MGRKQHQSSTGASTGHRGTPFADALRDFEAFHLTNVEASAYSVAVAGDQLLLVVEYERGVRGWDAFVPLTLANSVRVTCESLHTWATHRIVPLPIDVVRSGGPKPVRVGDAGLSIADAEAVAWCILDLCACLRLNSAASEEGGSR